MTDTAVRAVVALVAIVGPVMAAWVAVRPRRARSGEAPGELGPFPAVLLFTSSTCPTCPPAKVVVEEVCGDHHELAWPRDTVAFHKLGVGVVPATFVVGPRGRIIESFEGVPDARRLRRALSRAGLA